MRIYLSLSLCHIVLYGDTIALTPPYNMRHCPSLITSHSQGALSGTGIRTGACTGALGVGRSVVVLGEGRKVGRGVGRSVGLKVVGGDDGLLVGCGVGRSVGLKVGGADVGLLVGLCVGTGVGRRVGRSVGLKVCSGDDDGLLVGLCVGSLDRASLIVRFVLG